MSDPFYYNATLVRVIDGDTIDVDIDLGFSVWLKKQRIRLAGIDTPESRTRNKEEKVMGLAAKERLKELCGEKLAVQSLGRGKYGRVMTMVVSLQTIRPRKRTRRGRRRMCPL